MSKKKRFFHSAHKKRPFDYNADIERVKAKNRFFQGDHKKSFGRNIDIKRVMAKKKRFFFSFIVIISSFFLGLFLKRVC